VPAELDEPVVVDLEHLVGGLGVIEPRGRAEDAVDHLGVDAVALHVERAELGVGGAADALLAVFVEAGRGHHVDAVVGARDVLRAGGADAVHQPEGRAVLAGPEGPVRPVCDVGHAILHRRRGVAGEQIRRDPRQVDVAVGGNPVVGHVTLPFENGSGARGLVLERFAGPAGEPP
jgi:hypothetical protein